MNSFPSIPQSSEQGSPRWDLLIPKYLEGTLTSDEFTEVEIALRETAFQERLAQFALDEAELRANVLNHRTLVNLADHFSLFFQGSDRGHRSRSRWRIVAGVLLLVLTVGGVGFYQWSGGFFSLVKNDSAGPPPSVPASPRASAPMIPQNPAPSPLITIVESTGVASLDQRVAGIGMELKSGSILQLMDEVSAVKVRFQDGTQIQLAGIAEAIFEIVDDQKRVIVKQGSIAASVKPQNPDRPLLVLTPDSKIEVVGTDLAVSSGPAATDLVVSSGQVRMIRRMDGKEAMVRQGERTTSSGDRGMQVNPLSVVPASWSEDFSQSIPDGWEGGIWSAGDAESKGIALLQPLENWPHHSIHTRKSWTEGLMRITEQSHFNMRFKMGRPGFYQILLVVRGPVLRASTITGVYEYQELKPSHVPADEWRTISVPFSLFKKNETWRDNRRVPFELRDGAAPAPGDIVYLMIVSSQDWDRQMAIDRLWVSDESVAPQP